MAKRRGKGASQPTDKPTLAPVTPAFAEAVPGGPEPFWRTIALKDMNPEQWESLCDGCGQCCLIKLIDEDTEELVHTRLACTLLNVGSCRCRDYSNRWATVPDCVQLTPEAISTLNWLPRTCAYRLVEEGKDLNWWHPLVSGDPSTVHAAGVSVRSFARSEKGVAQEKIWKYIIDDPSADK
jgi:uncharacterized protein